MPPWPRPRPQKNDLKTGLKDYITDSNTTEWFAHSLGQKRWEIYRMN